MKPPIEYRPQKLPKALRRNILPEPEASAAFKAGDGKTLLELAKANEKAKSFDRPEYQRKYMRDYMRKYRARKKQG